MLVNGWPGFHGLQIEATESLTVGEWVAGLKERWDGRTDVINARVLVVLVVFAAVLARSWVRYRATRPFSGASILIFDIESAE